MADVYIFTEEEDEHLKDDVDDGGGGEEPANLSPIQKNSISKKYNFSCFSQANSDVSDIVSHGQMARPEDFTTRSSSEDQRLGGSPLMPENDPGCRMHDDDDDLTAEDDEDEEANMDPLTRLIKCAEADNFYDKQTVVRTLHETLRYTLDSPEDVATVLDVMGSLSSNYDPLLRTELMEQVPQIAFLAHDHPDKLDTVVTSTLVPMVVKYLTDQSDQVRKTSQAALLVLLEQELVSHEDVYEQVCPVILDLTEPDAVDDFKTEAVALMSKMAPLVGREMTERLFVERFTRLCSDSLFQVRKVCAANFGDFSGVVGTTATESTLLPRFVCLCEDGVWGVRKACADVFMAVSCSCSMEIRKEHLSPVFVSLLSDHSRWVRIAAFQNLGPFISTFADESTKLRYNEEGKLILEPASPQKKAEPNSSSDSEESGTFTEFKKSDANAGGTQSSPDKKNDMEITEKDIEDAIKLIEGIDFSVDADGNIIKNQSSKNLNWDRDENISDCNDSLPLRKDLGNDDPMFNELNYWRVPLPQVFLEIDLVETETNAVQTIFIQSNEVIDNNESSEKISNDDVQAELEALAASFAETFLSNEGVVDEKLSEDNQDRSDVITVEENLASQPIELEMHGSKEEDKKLTYAEICSSSIANSAKKSKLESPTSFSEEGNIKLSASIEESLEKESELKDVISNQDTKEYSSSGSDDDDEDTIVFHPTSNSDSFQHSESNTEIKTNTDTSSDIFSFIDHLASFNLGSLADGFADQSQRKLRRCRDIPRTATLSALNVNQDIVPNTLLEHYISMTDPIQAETVDNEITRHCAYSIPAVAFTLGRAYWPVLRETYETLAADMHWKVRRTLAFSIHELAHILGEDLAQKDLLPVFEGFIKDLDEVRIGVLKHLSHFLKLLSQDHRNLFLPRLNEFLNPDNAHNWRFRLELALQLAPISDLFSPEECWKFICPITFALMADKVMQIRKTCFGVVSHIARHLMAEDVETYILPFSRKLEEKFAQAQTWTKRQSYVYVVGQIIWDNSLPLSVVSSIFLPKFLELASDKVPNIRLAIAKIINSTILTKEYFSNDGNEATSEVEKVLDRLKNDYDRDVQYFAFNPIGSQALFEIND